MQLSIYYQYTFSIHSIVDIHFNMLLMETYYWLKIIQQIWQIRVWKNHILLYDLSSTTFWIFIWEINMRKTLAHNINIKYIANIIDVCTSNMNIWEIMNYQWWHWLQWNYLSLLNFRFDANVVSMRNCILNIFFQFYIF